MWCPVLLNPVPTLSSEEITFALLYRLTTKLLLPVAYVLRQRSNSSEWAVARQIEGHRDWQPRDYGTNLEIVAQFSLGQPLIDFSGSLPE